MKQINWLLILTIFALLSPVAQAQYCTDDTRYTEVVEFDTADVTITKDLEYAQAVNYQGTTDTLLLDLYYPNMALDPSPLRPFILMMHGGGFVGGGKELTDINNVAFHLAQRGFVSASINYRLGHNSTPYEALKARYRAMQDGHAALRYIVENASTYRIDTSWIFVGGQSAGAINAHSLIYSDPGELDTLALALNPTTLSSDLGDLYTSGNTFTHSYTIRGLFNNWGWGMDPFIQPEEMVPTIAFHGELDSTVDIDAVTLIPNYTQNGSRAMHQKLTAANVCSEITVDPLGGHGIYRNASSQFRAQRASCFFKSVFCEECNSFSTNDSIAPDCSITLDVAELTSQSVVRVYPNPVRDRLTIEGVDGPVQAMVYDAVGRLMPVRLQGTAIDFSGLNAGLYLVRIQPQNSNQVQAVRVVKN